MPELSKSEALFVVNRIWELHESPVVGRFDVAHLCEIHRRLFQDIPQYHPGQLRPDAPYHLKARALGSFHVRYYVPYAPRKTIVEGLARTLHPVLLSELSRLSEVAFVQRLAALYSELDYWHPFEEGNSRTLREFTRQLAHSCGYELDWGATSADEHAQDVLYLARDRAVFARAFPKLTAQIAMTTDNRIEFEAYMIMQQFRSVPTLETLLAEWVQPARERRRSRSQDIELGD